MATFYAHCEGICLAHSPGGPDAAVENSATVAISGSVGVGGRNLAADVKAIQAALNDIPPADGGADPKLAVDGIAGPKTNRAIARFQQRNIGWSDGRIDPGGPTLKAINARRLISRAYAKGGPGSKTPTRATLAQQERFLTNIGARLPDAMLWVQAAIRTLDFARDFHSAGEGCLIPRFGADAAALVDKWFRTQKLASAAAKIELIDRVQGVFRNMRMAINESQITLAVSGWGAGYFQPDPKDGKPGSEKYDAYSFFGGWRSASGANSNLPRMSAEDNYEGPNLRQDAMYFRVSFYMSRSYHPDYVTCVMVHELAHFCGPRGGDDEIRDYTYESRRDFRTVAPKQASRTAAIFAYFAGEAYLKREPRGRVYPTVK